ncbi:hypothetical protein J7L48_03500 [bacterium]|nr:hypothetical protein [bacterium]
MKVKTFFFALFLLVIIVNIHGQYVFTNDFQLKNIKVKQVIPTFAITSGVMYFSKGIFLNIGFTKEEAKYYSIFTGICAGLLYEYINNYGTHSFDRESNFVGIGLSLVVTRW